MIGRSSQAQIPYSMFDPQFTHLEGRTAQKLESIYHMGQEKIWVGNEVLDQLIAKHGPPVIEERQRKALGRVFAIIMWGELAAWRVAAQLADQLEPLEAKMAATSQAHDEARHFYVMHRYLTLANALPDRLDPASDRVLRGILGQTNLAKKLLGMQLLVEPVALTLFQAVRELRVEPVLADLMRYYERDEARHVGLGVQFLPVLVRRMSFAEQLDLTGFEFRLTLWLMNSLSEIGEDLEVIGIHPRRLLELAKGKTLRAMRLLFDSMGMGRFQLNTKVLGHVVEPIVETWFPGPGEANDWWSWATRTGKAFWKGLGEEEGTLEVA